jgi:hypothetical protein
MTKRRTKNGTKNRHKISKQSKKNIKRGFNKGKSYKGGKFRIGLTNWLQGSTKDQLRNDWKNEKCEEVFQYFNSNKSNNPIKIRQLDSCVKIGNKLNIDVDPILKLQANPISMPVKTGISYGTSALRNVPYNIKNVYYWDNKKQPDQLEKEKLEVYEKIRNQQQKEKIKQLFPENSTDEPEYIKNVGEEGDIWNDPEDLSYNEKISEPFDSTLSQIENENPLFDTNEDQNNAKPLPEVNNEIKIPVNTRKQGYLWGYYGGSRKKRNKKSRKFKKHIHP